MRRQGNENTNANASAYVVSNHSGYTTKIALYKKPNMIFRFIIWSAGWHIEEAGE